jgi:hypothetical protein
MSATGTPSPFRRRGFILAAAVVAVIVLAAIIVAVSFLTRGSTNPTTAPTTPAPSASPTGDAADESVCGLPGFETENTLTSAPETDWELVGTVAAPTDPTESGPGLIDDAGFRSCYAHTAKGALYAAINISAMSTDSRLAPELSERFLVPGPGRDLAIERDKANQGGTGSENLRAQVAGFKIASYTAEEATVDLVFQVSTTGALVSIPTVLQWHDGDWKGVTDDQGNSPLEPAQLDNLGGYIPWSGA